MSSPSTITTKSASRVARKPRTTANPFPRRLSCSTVAPASLARSDGRVGRGVVDDDDQRAGQRAPEVLDDLADALLLVAAGNDDRDGLARPPERGTERPAQLRRGHRLRHRHRSAHRPSPWRPNSTAPSPRRVRRRPARRVAPDRRASSDIRRGTSSGVSHACDDRPRHPPRIAFVPEQRDGKSRRDGLLDRERETLARRGVQHDVGAREQLGHPRVRHHAQIDERRSREVTLPPAHDEGVVRRARARNRTSRFFFSLSRPAKRASTPSSGSPKLRRSARRSSQRARMEPVDVDAVADEVHLAPAPALELVVHPGVVGHDRIGAADERRPDRQSTQRAGSRSARRSGTGRTRRAP